MVFFFTEVFISSYSCGKGSMEYLYKISIQHSLFIRFFSCDYEIKKFTTFNFGMKYLQNFKHLPLRRSLIFLPISSYSQLRTVRPQCVCINMCVLSVALEMSVKSLDSVIVKSLCFRMSYTSWLRSLATGPVTLGRPDSQIKELTASKMEQSAHFN